MKRNSAPQYKSRGTGRATARTAVAPSALAPARPTPVARAAVGAPSAARARRTKALAGHAGNASSSPEATRATVARRGPRPGPLALPRSPTTEAALGTGVGPFGTTAQGRTGTAVGTPQAPGADVPPATRDARRRAAYLLALAGVGPVGMPRTDGSLVEATLALLCVLREQRVECRLTRLLCARCAKRQP